MTVSVVNQWSAKFSQPTGFVNTPPIGKATWATIGNTTGNWLICVAGWQSPSTYTTTVSVGDDAGNLWVPLGAPVGTSSAGGNTRCVVWAAPYAMAATTVWVSPTDYAPGLAALVCEVSGLGPGLSLAGVQTAYVNSGTSLSLSLPAPASSSLAIACAASDNSGDTVTMAGSGWTGLTTVTATNGVNTLGDLVLTSGWQVTTGSVSPSWSSTGAQDLSACVVEVAVVQAAPTGPSQGWPLIQWQAAFGGGMSTPWDQLQWTDLTARFRGLGGTRGKQYELDSVQAASMQPLLSNNDGALTPGLTSSPYYQGLSPWTGLNNASLFLNQAYAFTGANSMLITPDGATTFPGAISEQEPVTAGSVYTASAAVLCPQGWTTGVRTAIFWYNSAGGLIGSSSGSPVAATAGQWVFPQESGTAPASTAFGALVIQASGTPPSTTLFYADYCTLTSPSGVLLNQNWCFSTGPQVYTPIRLLGTWAARTYSAWRGFMERWPISMDSARYTQTGATATDVWAGLTSLQPSTVQGEYLADNPWAYWPCTDLAGSTQAANLAPTEAGPLVVAESKFGTGATGTQVFGASSGAITGDPSGTVWEQSGLVSGTTDIKHGSCLQYQAAAASTPSITNGLTIEGWHLFSGAQPNGFLIIWALQGSSGTIAELVGDYDGSGAGLGWYLNLTDKNTKVVTNTRVYAFGIETLGWSLWSVTLTPTEWTLSIDGGGYAPTVASGTCNLASQWEWITWGGSADKISTGQCANISLAHLCITPRVLPQTRFVAHTFAGGIPGEVGGLGGDSGDARIQRLLGYASMLVARRIGTIPTDIQPALDIIGQACSQNVTNVGQSDSGLLYVDRCGYLAYSSRALRWNLTPAQAIGENAGAILNQTWDFETGTGPWTISAGATITQSSAASFAGTHSMLVTPSSTVTGPFTENIPVTAAASYTGTAMVMSPGGWSAGAHIQVNWFTPSGGYISTSTGTATALNAGQWTAISFTVTAVTGAGYANMLVTLAGTPSGSNTFYVDLAFFTAPGEIPYLGDISFDYDPSLIFNDLTLNQYDGTTITASSATSMAQYGDQTLQETTYLTDVNLTTDLANWILGNYGIPQIRAAQFTINPAANPYAWPFILSADVGTVITLSRRLQGTELVITGEFEIQSVSPSISTGQYQVKYSATPYFGQVLATNSPVYGLPNGQNSLAW